MQSRFFQSFGNCFDLFRCKWLAFQFSYFSILIHFRLFCVTKLMSITFLLIMLSIYYFSSFYSFARLSIDSVFFFCWTLFSDYWLYFYYLWFDLQFEQVCSDIIDKQSMIQMIVCRTDRFNVFYLTKSPTDWQSSPTTHSARVPFEGKLSTGSKISKIISIRLGATRFIETTWLSIGPELGWSPYALGLLHFISFTQTNLSKINLNRAEK